MNQSDLPNQVINDHQFYRDKLFKIKGVELYDKIDGIDFSYYKIFIEIKETRQTRKHNPYRSFCIKLKDLKSKWILFICNKRFIYALLTDYVDLSTSVRDNQCGFGRISLKSVREISIFKGRNLENILKQIKEYENGKKI